MEFAPPTFECAVEVRGDAAVVVPRGELDLASSGRFEAAVRSAAAGGKPSLTIDLRELEFCDSTGLHTIVTLVQELSPDRHITVITHSPTIAVELNGYAHVDVFLIGGRVYPPLMTAQNLIGHYSPIHNVNDGGVEFGDRFGYFPPQAIVCQSALSLPIDKENSDVQPDCA